MSIGAVESVEVQKHARDRGKAIVALERFVAIKNAYRQMFVATGECGQSSG